jgi:hypothetical protein
MKALIKSFTKDGKNGWVVDIILLLAILATSSTFRLGR